MTSLRLGIDLGGTKIEVVVLEHSQELYRKRIATPSHSYVDIIAAIAGLVIECRQKFGEKLSVGIGMPGAITVAGLVKNSNTVCMNGKPFQSDIENAIQQEVRVMNDANCFALSEAVDGAAVNAFCVFGIILGTGVGGGIVIRQKPVRGCNSIAGEWGHNPLPMTAPKASMEKRLCYCGKTDCIETYLCGAGLAKTWFEMTGTENSSRQISALLQEKNPDAITVCRLYRQQLGASLATVINVLDPDVIVLGGGVSNLPGLAENTQALLPQYVFSDSVNTRVVLNQYGDSSGVRGAAWLWPD